MKIIKNRIKNFLLLFAKKLKSTEIQDKQNIQRQFSDFSIGKHTYGSGNIIVDRYKGSDSKIIIGKYCSIATNVNMITGGVHPVDRISTYPFRAKFNLEGKYEDGIPYSKGPILIGNDVWISSNVTILSGVEVGDGAVLASNTVVVKNVPAYAIVGGNPAKVIRKRFTEIQIEKLRKIQWWNWEDKRVNETIPFLNSNNIDAFLEKYYIAE